MSHQGLQLLARDRTLSYDVSRHVLQIYTTTCTQMRSRKALQHRIWMWLMCFNPKSYVKKPYLQNTLYVSPDVTSVLDDCWTHKVHAEACSAVQKHIHNDGTPGYRLPLAWKDPVSAPQPQACEHWGVTEFCSGFPGLFMYLARCLPSSGWLPYPLGFYLMFLLACLLSGLITLAFLPLPQPRAWGCGPSSATLHLPGFPRELYCTLQNYNCCQPTSLRISPLSLRLSVNTNWNSQFRANQTAEALTKVRAKVQHSWPSCEDLPDQYSGSGRWNFWI